MDEESSTSEMARKSGSFLCISKRSITTTLNCIISCLIFVALLYLLLIVVDIATLAKVGSLFQAIGYISLAVLLSVPIGLYGAAKNSYCALFVYLILTSYLLYALILYIWLNVKSCSFFCNYSNSEEEKLRARLGGEFTLHQVTIGAYTGVLALSLMVTSLKIISTTLQFEPTKVIVVDNNPLD